MSTNSAALARRRSTLPGGPALLLLVTIPLVSTIALRATSAADPSAAPALLDASQARRAGQLIELRRHPDLPAPLVEVVGTGPLTPIAVTADGSAIALADRPGLDPATLVIAAADGSQVRVQMDGLLAAGFAPDGSWLAASDGTGRLWRISRDGALPAPLADGPFAGPILVEPSGSILTLAVASVEAPFTARLVRLNAVSGGTVELVDEELVYDVQPLRQGGLAIIAHHPDGTVVESLRDGALHVVAGLGAGAINVSVSADERTIAWERNGEVYVRSDAGEVRIATGTRPRISPDGSMLTIETNGGGRALAPDGSLLAALAGPAVLLPCGECGS
jgi:hypothetical protein